MSATEQALAVRRILNPVDPRGIEDERWEWRPGLTLADYFPPGSAEHVVSINGKLIDEKDFPVTELVESDTLIICPVLHGGGDDKSVLRMIAMIAVTVMAPYAASAILGVQSGVAYTAMTMGIQIAGSLLVNSLLPPGQPGSESKADARQSFGMDGAKNTAAENVVVPIVYGEMRVGGNVIAMHTENVGDTQFVYVLIAVSEGPIWWIGDVQFNDQPWTNFKDVSFAAQSGWSAHGTPQQGLIEWFDNTLVPIPVGRKATVDWTQITTTTEVDQFRIDFVAPQGLFKINGAGNAEPVAVPLVVQYRKVGNTVWETLADSSYVSEYTTIYVYESWQATGDWTSSEPLGPAPVFEQVREERSTLKPGTYASGSAIYDSNTGEVVGSVIQRATYAQAIEISDNSRAAVRKSVSTPIIEQGVYEIRFRRGVYESTDPRYVDEVWVTDLNEIVHDDVVYQHTGLLACRIKLTDQLSSLPTISMLVKGRMLRVWDFNTGFWAEKLEPHCSNPAWITWDILTNTRYGGAVPFSRMDLSAWRDWALFCKNNKLEFNGVIDAEMTVWDAANMVARCGRAQLVNVGTRWTVVVERDEAASMMFSVANMVEGSFKSVWTGVQDRANEIEISYTDKNANYDRKTIRVYDAAALAAGQRPKTAAIQIPGIVEFDRAYQEGMLHLNLNRYVLQSIEFSAPLEAISCRVGEVIWVQHDMPKWGLAGRLQKGSTATTLLLDRPVKMVSGKEYKVLIHYSALQRASGTISSVQFNSIYVPKSGFPTALLSNGQAHRLQANGYDRRIEGIYDSGSTYGIMLDDATGIGAGQSFTIWQTDAIEDRKVVLQPGETSQVTVQSALPDAPAVHTQWMFGELTKGQKPFRVKSITGSHEYHREIRAIEYNASVYDFDGIAYPTPNYSELSPFPEHAQITDITETLIRQNNTIQTLVTVYFKSDQETYSSSRVWVSVDGRPFEVLIEYATGRTSIIANDGAVIKFKVQARDAAGALAPESTAPVATHTVLGKTAPPADVASLSVAVEEFGLRLSWPEVQELDIAGYELRVGEFWDGAQQIARVSANSYFWRTQQTGNVKILIRAFDTGGRLSVNATSATVGISGAKIARYGYRFLDGNLVIETVSSPGDEGFAVKELEFRYGDTWESGTFVAKVSTSSFSTPVQWLGPRTFWVAAIDVAENVGSPVRIDVTVEPPRTITPSVEVIDNNVLMRWSPAAGSLPVARHEIRRGGDWNSGEIVAAVGSATFATFFEKTGGTFTYWIAGIDSAGNVGAAAPVTVKVNAPPDFELIKDHTSTFNGTMSGMAKDGNFWFAPVIAETFEAHFSARGWTTPQAQIDAGYPVYYQPAGTSGYYEEEIDVGEVITGSSIDVALSFEGVSGNVQITPRISTRASAGNAWTDHASGLTSVFATNFRYVKIRIDFLSVTDTALVKIHSLRMNIGIKTRDDNGIGSAAAGDAGGTQVTFNVPFIDVESIIVTPKGVAATYAVVNFSDIPNPTSFRVLLFDASGNRVSGDFMWTAKGV